MRIFVAGATGAVGMRLVPMLAAAGHDVVGTTRSEHKMETLRNLGAEPLVVDVLDREAVMAAVRSARPEVVVHEATSLAGMRSLRNFDEQFALTSRLRVEGTEHLVGAARAAGATRLVAQSYAGWPNERSGERVTTEADRLDPDPPRSMRRTLDAIRRLEELVCGADDLVGVVLRYGSLYGPGTSVAPGGDLVEAVRRHRLPIVGDGAGVWSWLHVDDCAAATRLAIERGPAGVYNVVDDEPAPVSDWLPDLARAIGARPPSRFPAWLGRLVLGQAGVFLMTRICGSSNAKAKRVLNWQPKYASWREGFRNGLQVELTKGNGYRSVSSRHVA
jgi:nucleoside-diphosphate-sugar epimerase